MSLPQIKKLEPLVEDVITASQALKDQLKEILPENGHRLPGKGLGDYSIADAIKLSQALLEAVKAPLPVPDHHTSQKPHPPQ